MAQQKPRKTEAAPRRRARGAGDERHSVSDAAPQARTAVAPTRRAGSAGKAFGGVSSPSARRRKTTLTRERRATATSRAPGTQMTGEARQRTSQVAARSRVAAAGAGAGDSPGVRRALWIESPDQHAERSGQTLATQNHDVIRQWAVERGATPATVPGTERDGRPGVLRFDFPEYSGRRLRAVDWDEWFETFDERRLVFLFQEQMSRGRTSSFFRLDSPDRQEG